MTRTTWHVVGSALGVLVIGLGLAPQVNTQSAATSSLAYVQTRNEDFGRTRTLLGLAGPAAGRRGPARALRRSTNSTGQPLSEASRPPGDDQRPARDVGRHVEHTAPSGAPRDFRT